MKRELASQYRAALKMLRQTIERCPDWLWNDQAYENVYWRIAYHTLHYTNLYLAENPDVFMPWAKHLPNYHRLGQVLSPEQTAEHILYSKVDLFAYGLDISNSVESRLEAQDLTEGSGFDWLRMNKLELHLYNIRHIQHHTGQLIERLHQHGIKGIDWIDTDRD